MLCGAVPSSVRWGIVAMLMVTSILFTSCVAPDGQVYVLDQTLAAKELDATARAVAQAEANKAFIADYFAAFNADYQAAIDQYIVDEVLIHHIDIFETAFPGYQLTAEEMVAEGNRVFVRTTFRGVHTGDLMGIPPTGKAVEIALALIYVVEDGKIVDHWMLADQLTMLQQIGVIPVE